MRPLVLFAGAVLVAVGYGASMLPGGSGESASGGNSARSQGSSEEGSSSFPKAGIYDIVRERAGERDQANMWVDASNRPAFEELVTRDDGNCRDRSVSIGSGTFSIRMTCDAPDGDIHNIMVQRHGSYSTSSIEITTETTLWGTPIRESERYQLRKDS